MEDIIEYMRVFNWLFTAVAIFSALVMVKDINGPVGKPRPQPPSRFR